ncbi:hypothetical protein INT45_012180 [Circinella minor]|uniref:Uncharacterized protein n=1 Tax=Circinella minor TaxID=1195481 RepID=A0A8H7SBZ0_9FUNG|nr:hypothetical protein INT45_012180 [Circinella minor]
MKLIVGHNLLLFTIFLLILVVGSLGDQQLTKKSNKVSSSSKRDVQPAQAPDVLWGAYQTLYNQYLSRYLSDWQERLRQQPSPLPLPLPLPILPPPFYQLPPGTPLPPLPPLPPGLPLPPLPPLPPFPPFPF